MNRPRLTAAALAATLAAATIAVGAVPSPTIEYTPTARYVTASFIAEETGTYALDSTYFRAGVDPWGRTKQTAVATTGQRVSFRAPCYVTRATYSYRVVTPGGATGPSTSGKCV